MNPELLEGGAQMGDKSKGKKDKKIKKPKQGKK
jgi:hypothetical protein